MQGVGAEQLKRVIESQHGGTATFVQAMRIVMPKAAQSDWDGVVHVFDLQNNPKAKRAYAWASSIQGSNKPRYFAVLHAGKVTDPIEAVKAAVGAIKKWGNPGGKK
jgi:hypothetical protein